MTPSGHPVIGICGRMNSGKTWLTERLWAAMVRRGLDPVSVRLDALRFQAVAGACPGRREREVRARLRREFGLPVPDRDCWDVFDYLDFMKVVLHSVEGRDAYMDILRPYLVDRVRSETRRSAGPVLLEWVAPLEDGFGPLLDGPIVLVTCSGEEITRRDGQGARSRISDCEKRRSLQPSDEEFEATAAMMGIPLIKVDTTEGVTPDAVGRLVDDLQKAWLGLASWPLGSSP